MGAASGAWLGLLVGLLIGLFTPGILWLTLILVALLFGALLALWSASGYVGAFGRAMNRIYEIGEGRPFWKLRPIMLLITAVYVDPKSVEGIRFALQALLGDTQAREDLGRKALARAAEFSWDRTTDALLDTYAGAAAEFAERQAAGLRAAAGIA